jgi:hypothetical protein
MDSGLSLGNRETMEHPVLPTDPEREEALGRIALWLDPDDLRWLMHHCCCPADASEAQRSQCMRLRFRAGAALHQAGISQDLDSDSTIQNPKSKIQNP